MCSAAPSTTKTTADARRRRAAEKLRGHRLQISVISELYHTWMNAVMRAEGSLDANSLPLLPQEDSAAFLLDRFRKLWMGSLGQATGDGRTVRRVVVRLLQPRFGLIGLWNVLDACSNFAQPIIVATLVRDLRLRSADRLGWDFALVGLLTLTSLGGAVSIQQVLWGGARMGMRAKLALSSAVYAKTLSLGNAALLATSAGSAASLVGIDVFRLEQSFTFFHMLWCAWLGLGLVTFFHMLWCAALARTPRRTPRRTARHTPRRTARRTARRSGGIAGVPA